MIDPYKVLGVSKSAGQDEIKKAFKNLAKKYHPDRNPDNKEAETKFKEINEAYDLIGTKEAREKYDRGDFGDYFGGEHGQVDPALEDAITSTLGPKALTSHLEAQTLIFLKIFLVLAEVVQVVRVDEVIASKVKINCIVWKWILKMPF